MKRSVKWNRVVFIAAAKVNWSQVLFYVKSTNVYVHHITLSMGNKFPTIYQLRGRNLYPNFTDEETWT